MAAHSRLVAGLALAAALASPLTALPARAAGEALVEPEQVAAQVTVEDVSERDGTVSGTIVNRSSRAVKNVRLRILFDWYWNNEKHPGKDEPSFAAERDVPGEIPPNGRVPVTYEFRERQKGRTDGYYHVEIHVVGFTSAGTSTTSP